MADEMTNGYGSGSISSRGVMVAPKTPETIAREELTGMLKRLEDRRHMRRAELDQAQMQFRFLEREVATLDQACESLAGVIHRSEEVDDKPSPSTVNRWAVNPPGNGL